MAWLHALQSALACDKRVAFLHGAVRTVCMSSFTPRAPVELLGRQHCSLHGRHRLGRIRGHLRYDTICPCQIPWSGQAPAQARAPWTFHVWQSMQERAGALLVHPHTLPFRRAGKSWKHMLMAPSFGPPPHTPTMSMLCPRAIIFLDERARLKSLLPLHRAGVRSHLAGVPGGAGPAGPCQLHPHGLHVSSLCVYACCLSPLHSCVFVCPLLGLVNSIPMAFM